MELYTILTYVPEVFSAIVLLATAVAKLTPTDSDDKKVKEWSEKIHKVLLYFPTLGKDPYVKKLEEKLEKK